MSQYNEILAGAKGLRPEEIKELADELYRCLSVPPEVKILRHTVGGYKAAVTRQSKEIETLKAGIRRMKDDIETVDKLRNELSSAVHEVSRLRVRLSEETALRKLYGGIAQGWSPQTPIDAQRQAEEDAEEAQSIRLAERRITKTEEYERAMQVVRDHGGK